MKIVYMGAKAADHAATLTAAGVKNEVRQDVMLEVLVNEADLGPALKLIRGFDHL